MPVIVGAGGHAKVVLDALLVSGVARESIVLRDGDPARAGDEVLGFTVLCPERADTDALVHIAIGSNIVRERLGSEARELVSIVHPAAMIAGSAHVAGGAFIAACAVLGPDARLAEGVILNHGAVVDHDCAIAAYAHVAPGAVLGGGVVVGARTLVGAGATVLPGVVIGNDVTIGAGAVVLRDIGDGETWAGNPATRLG